MIKQQNHLQSTIIETPLGTMIAIAHDKALLLLEFTDNTKRIKKEIHSINQQIQAPIAAESHPILALITHEIKQYFAGKLDQFTTPIQFTGTPFQQRVHKALYTIPYGKTMSYKQLATLIGKPSAYRAVANANGANKLGLIVPCHRVIKNDGSLGGYAGGISKKEWFIAHERSLALNNDKGSLDRYNIITQI